MTFMDGAKTHVKYSGNSEEKHNSSIGFLMEDIIFDMVV